MRKAGVIWAGDLKSGEGHISTESQALYEQPYNFSTRFENEPGTNPEELIAAAHAACYSMAFASTLKDKGYNPERVDTNAVCYLSSKDGGGFEIAKMSLHVRGQVPDIDADTFKELSKEADQGCPVSNLLRNGLEIEIDVELVETFAEVN
jgi:osmotically inducible protein OsmC